MQRRLILGIALLFIASEQVPAYDLSQYQWHHRLLFLIAPQADDPTSPRSNATWRSEPMPCSTAISACSGFSLIKDFWEKPHCPRKPSAHCAGNLM